MRERRLEWCNKRRGISRSYATVRPRQSTHVIDCRETGSTESDMAVATI
jgi:hypothetical protein